MDDPADVSSQDGSGRHLLDEGFSTRNRKVVGSNPTSGSISAPMGSGLVKRRGRIRPRPGPGVAGL
jgi:hypothetical protein